MDEDATVDALRQKVAETLKVKESNRVRMAYLRHHVDGEAVEV